MDPSRAPFPSDNGSLRGVVVDEARPPGIAFHLGPDQVPGRINTGDTAQTEALGLTCILLTEEGMQCSKQRACRRAWKAAGRCDLV